MRWRKILADFAILFVSFLIQISTSIHTIKGNEALTKTFPPWTDEVIPSKPYPAKICIISIYVGTNWYLIISYAGTVKQQHSCYLLIFQTPILHNYAYMNFKQIFI